MVGIRSPTYILMSSDVHQVFQHVVEAATCTSLLSSSIIPSRFLVVQLRHCRM